MNTDHTIAEPTEPGLYESEVLGDRVTIRLNANGTADAIVDTGDTTYISVILDVRHYASIYGPFRRLDEGEPEPTPTSAPEPTATPEPLADWELELLGQTPPQEPEGKHEAELNDLDVPEEVAA